MGKRMILAVACVLAILGMSGERTVSAENYTHFTYDAEGRVTSVTSPQGEIAYEYSSITGRMTFMRTPPDGSDTEIEYFYDPLGRLSQVVVHRRNGVAVNERFDYTYNAVGSLQRLCRPNGDCSIYTYDALNRLTELKNQDSMGNVLSRFAYQLNVDGTRHSVTETFAGQDTTITWSYDNLNRLTREVYDAPGTADDYTEDYRYDVVGNRVRKDRNGSPQVYSFYDARDRLLKETSDAQGNNILAEYQYNNNGSLTQMTAGANVTTYAYNLQNQLTSVNNGTTVVNYEYNPDGKRVKKQVVGGSTTNYLIDSHNHTGYPQVAKETTGSMNISYVIGHALLSQNVGTNSPQYMIHDGHGSVRQVANLAGTVTSNYHYDAYGKMLPRSDTPETKILYVGQMWDSDLGFYDNWHRWYDPPTGRFNQEDTFAGNNYDPISLHKYLYAHANPINGIDPSGQMSLTEGITVVGIGLNLVSFYCDMSRGIRETGRGNYAESSKSFAWAMVDALALSMPFSGPGLSMAGGSSALAANVEAMAKSGMSASAIWGYLSSLSQVAQAMGGSSGGSFGSGGGGSAGGPPGGELVDEDTGGLGGKWYKLKVTNELAAKYQSLRNGKPPGWDYYYNGVKFDGRRGQALLESKANWNSLVQKSTGKFYEFMDEVILDQVKRQDAARNGLQVIWEFSDKEAADACRELFRKNTINFEVRYAPMP